MQEPDEQILDARLRAANAALDAKVAASVDVEAALARVKRNATRRQLVGSGAPTLSRHRTIVAFDVEGFGSRTDRHQSAVREGLYASLEQAFNESGIPWRECDTSHDRGDGVLVLVPPSVAHVRLVDGLPNRLTATLRRHNAIHATEAQIRLRMAVHAGEVAYDNRGIAGQAVNLACRMMDAPVLKAVLASSGGVFALMVSDLFYREVVQYEPTTRPDLYREVTVGAKAELDTPAWIRLPADVLATADPEQASADVDVATRRHERWPGYSARLPDSLSTLAGRLQPLVRSVIGRVAPARSGRELNEPPPRELPADVPDFIGRTAELDRLDAMADEGQPRVVVVDGPAGVGKTALAVHWAHRQTQQFPDGHLFVDLRGFHQHQQPTEPTDSLRRLLRAVGVHAQRIPPDLDEQSRLYRSVMADKRMLVVLDNAGSAGQVRPLLPGSPGSLAVVTSRTRLTGLTASEGAGRIGLDVLSPADSVVLLARSAEDAEPDATAELARLCGHMPLALRIAAERVAGEHMRVRKLVEELQDEQGRLLGWSSTDGGNTAMRAVFSWSYNGLSPDAARLFRLLGIHPGPDIGIEAAGALAGVAPAQVRRLLDDLAGVHLVEQVGGNRYRLHDLLRLYAAELAREVDSEKDRDEALQRLTDREPPPS